MLTKTKIETGKTQFRCRPKITASVSIIVTTALFMLFGFCKH